MYPGNPILLCTTLGQMLKFKIGSVRIATDCLESPRHLLYVRSKTLDLCPVVSGDLEGELAVAVRYPLIGREEFCVVYDVKEVIRLFKIIETDYLLVGRF